jgi:hypothetical protein
MRLFSHGRVFGLHLAVAGLGLAVLLAGSGTALAGPLWCSPFETESGTAVIQGQAASAVANLTGADGVATQGNTLPAMIYVGYGTAGVPTIPASIDPAGQAGVFALSTPDNRYIGINTDIGSDAGNLLNALTFEGYFLMPVADPVTAPTSVGRRLVSLKRGSADESSRLAIGIQASGGTNRLAVYYYNGANQTVYGTTSLLANTWYHFAVVYNGTTITWYLNGVQEGQVTPSGLVGVGSGKIVIANNRRTGATSDRGFYGLLDDIRLYDRALTVPELAVSGAVPGSNLLWRSRFETEKGVAVVQGQEATTLNGIDNAVGPPHGSPAGLAASTYAAYGTTGVPAIPSALDPSGMAGTFALSMPDAPNVAINTNVPSNAGALATAMTVQGYFNSSLTSPETTTNIGDRLVSTMRAATTGNTRIGIGLTANADVSPTGNVLAMIWADPASVLTVVRGTTLIQKGTWYHFALTWDGVDLKFYLNGSLEGQVLGAPMIAPGTAIIAIGNDRTAGNGTRGFFGLLDKVVICDHVIPPSEFMIHGDDPCRQVSCNHPFADWDNNGQVDMVDYANLQLCLSPTPLGSSNQCLCFDRDDNKIVDQTDVAAFGRCATGPGILWSLDLVPDCVP